jgi:Tol biopolymer transport system component
MDLDGSNQKKLAAGNFPQCTPDGRLVIFGPRPLKKMSIDGGEPVQLTDKGSTGGAAISPDGKMIAAQYVQQPDIPAKIAIIPIEGGEPVKLFDASWPPRIPCIRWTADGRAVTYVANHDGVENIWSQPIDGGPPKQLTDFKSDEIFRFDWSRDGKRLVLSRGVESRDIVLIRDFK